jgi:2-oxoglutarate dehydrogenase E1 component
LALAYRQKYRKDVFLDIIGYRRYGHTEQDQPFFTQPIMYTKIAQKKNIYTLYTERMISEGVITDQEAKATWDSEIDKLKEAYVKSLSQTFDTDKWKSKSYHKMITLSDLG